MLLMFGILYVLFASLGKGDTLQRLCNEHLGIQMDTWWSLELSGTVATTLIGDFLSKEIWSCSEKPVRNAESFPLLKGKKQIYIDIHIHINIYLLVDLPLPPWCFSTLYLYSWYFRMRWWPLGTITMTWRCCLASREDVDVEPQVRGSYYGGKGCICIHASLSGVDVFFVKASEGNRHPSV